MTDIATMASQVEELIAKNQSFMVVFPDEVHDEVKASALALGQILQQLQKKVNISSLLPLEGQVRDLPLANQVQTKLGNKNLHIILDYSPDQVGRVFYDLNEEQQKFVMVVEPQKGQSPLDASQVKFDYAGAEADVIFVFGVQMFEQLDYLYTGYEDLYKTASTISFNHFQSGVANLNFDSSGLSGVSELMAGLVQRFNGVQLDGELATTLLFGLESATDQFRSPRTSAYTFELVSWLLKMGARRIYRNPGLNPLSSGMARIERPRGEVGDGGQNSLTQRTTQISSLVKPTIEQLDQAQSAGGSDARTLSESMSGLRDWQAERDESAQGVARDVSGDRVQTSSSHRFGIQVGESGQVSSQVDNPYQVSQSSQRSDGAENLDRLTSSSSASGQVGTQGDKNNFNQTGDIAGDHVQESSNHPTPVSSPAPTPEPAQFPGGSLIQDFAINQLRRSDLERAAEVNPDTQQTQVSQDRQDFPNQSTGFTHVSESMTKLQEAIKRQEELNKTAEQAGGLDHRPGGVKNI